MRKRTIALLLTIIMLCALLPVGVLADSGMETVKINVNYKQTEARSMLKLINDFRTGNDAWAWNSSDTKKIYSSDLKKLTYDYTLEKIAMQRAAEIAVNFGHTRPNGKYCFTLYNVKYSHAGENIAVGYTDAEDAFKGWQETNDNYAGQGHRRNMLESDYNAVGIGCVYYNGCYFWVQSFGALSATDTNKTKANDSSAVVSVEISKELLTSASLSASGGSSISIVAGKTADLPKLTAKIAMEKTRPKGSCTVTPKSNWKSADTSIAKISDGKLVGVSAGTTTISASALGKTVKIKVNVDSHVHNYVNGECTYCHDVIIAFKKQPADLNAASGTTGKFSVTVNGSGLSYQWQFLKPNGSWANSSATSGKTTTLSVNVREAIDGYKYRCIVKDKAGNSATSKTATLSVIPEITKQPTNLKAKSGSTGKFVINAKGDDLTYQWQYQKKGSSTWTNSGAKSGKTATLSVSVRSTIEGCKYRCKVTNACGNTVTSKTVTLTVTPAITKQPTNLKAKSGTTGKFNVTAEGVDLTYQWQYQKNGSSAWTNSGAKSGKTASFSVSVRAELNDCKYRCVIKDANGNSVTSSTVTLTVTPAITKQPANLKAAGGTTGKFSVTADGVGLTYKWQYQKPGSSTWTDATAKSAKTATLSVNVRSAINGYKYRCIIKDSAGNSVTSSTATLTVK